MNHQYTTDGYSNIVAEWDGGCFRERYKNPVSSGRGLEGLPAEIHHGVDVAEKGYMIYDI